MGGLIGRALSRISEIFGNKEARILILGLDNAGKTTILYRLQFREPIATVPTLGFNIETVQYKNVLMHVWDLGGQTSIRPFWRCYYPITNALIFVIDSTDKERLDQAKRELHLILEEEELKKVILLVLANKQDLPGALSVEEISNSLKLSSISNRSWTIIKTSALKNIGISEGMDWLVSSIT